MPPLSKEFLLSRGLCCGNGCLNCPYSPKHTKDSTEVIKIDDEQKSLPVNKKDSKHNNLIFRNNERTIRRSWQKSNNGKPL